MDLFDQCSGLMILPLLVLLFIMAPYLLDPGAWDRIRKGMSSRPPGRAPGSENKKGKGRSRK